MSIVEQNTGYAMDIRPFGPKITLWQAGRMLDGARASHDEQSPSQIIISGEQSQLVFGTFGNPWSHWRGIRLAIK